jgi:hypothetical protein
VGGGGATGALDWGWEVAEAADDSVQELRRCSSGASRSGRRKAVQMWVCECKRECTGSLGMCFKSRRRHGKREQVLASSVARVAVRAAAARRGGAGRAGAARGAKRGGVGQLGLGHMAGEGGGGSAERNRERRTGGRRRRTNMQFSKSAGTLL